MLYVTYWDHPSALDCRLEQNVGVLTNAEVLKASAYKMHGIIRGAPPVYAADATVACSVGLHMMAPCFGMGPQRS